MRWKYSLPSACTNGDGGTQSDRWSRPDMAARLRRPLAAPVGGTTEYGEQGH